MNTSPFDDHEEFLLWLSQNPDLLISVDTEGTGLRVRDRDFCIGISIAYDDEGYYFPVNHFVGENISDDLLSKLKYVLETRTQIVYQNAKYDIGSLLTVGIDLRTISFFDTAVIAQLLNENYPIRKDLDSLAVHYLGHAGKIKDKFIEKQKRTGNREITWEQMNDYAVLDAVTTWDLGQVLLQRLSEEPVLAQIWKHKERVLRVLLKMEGRGVRVDTELAKQMVLEGMAAMLRITAELGMNPGSNAQLAVLLIDKLGLPVLKRSEKTNKPSFDKTVMPIYEAMLERSENPTAQLIMEYRGWQKAVSASYRPYLELLGPDGRVRTTFRLDTARTGRWSSEAPNLQQIPKDSQKPWSKNTKACFLPAPGYVLVNADYSQLELRLGTCYAEEPHLVEVFNSGRDVFMEMAERLNMSRDRTKTLVYSMQYGAGEKRIMTAFGVSRDEARRIRNNYFQTYPRFQMFSDQCTAKAEQSLRVKIWSGRYRNFRYKSEAYKAMNSVIQGGASDIVERVLLALDEVVDDEVECRMLLQVHDAIVFEIREDLVEEYIPLIRTVMEDIAGAVGHNDFDAVHFAVEIAPDYGSKNWRAA